MRVITGNAKRLLLKTPGELDTRPVTDRIRETLFNVLQLDLPDYIFLDLSSGNGAIGIEALDRGAGLAVIIENNPRALGYIHENLARTKLEGRTMMMGCDVITGLERLEGKNYRFDIILMDPPYHHEYGRLVLGYLSRSPVITEDTLIMVEASKETDFGWLEEPDWHMIKSKEYKTNKYVFVGRGEQMRTAVYPGSFDSVTLGHYDVIEHTAKMVDKLIIGVLNNKTKCPLFSAQERINMLKEMTVSPPNIKIQSFEGLLINFMRGNHTGIVVRGLRAIADSEYELQMTQTNRVIAPEIDTIFSTTNLKYSYLSSSIVKGIAECEGDISEFLYPVITARIKGKLKERRRLT